MNYHGNIRFTIATVALMVLACVNYASAQDTVRVSLNDFISAGLKNSGEIKAERQKVLLAKNRISQTQTKRYLPEFTLNSQHGLIPGVKSDTNLDPNEYYLDPNLKNDFGDIGLFTRVEVKAVQPIFTWGALKNAINATRSAADAAEEQFEIKKDETQLRLYNLYQSYLLSLEVNRLLDEAEDQLNKIDKQINKKDKEKDSDIDESDVFKFSVFKSEFASRTAEVRENAKYVQSIWNYVMQGPKGTVYMPKDNFLDPVQNPIKTLGFYKNQALNKRPGIKALNAGIKAAKYGLKATKEKNYPSLFLGATGSYANTPNRPRQSNPFIINNTNYATAAIGFGVRQNLDFFSMKYDVKKSRIQYQQAQYSKDAVMDGIVLQISEKYKNAKVAKIKAANTDSALVTSKKWVRQEQLDYDLGIGDTKDLIDALKQELQLKVQRKQQIYNFNKEMAELFKAAALPVNSLTTNYQDHEETK